MGSSCFSRGNSANVEVIQKYIESRQLEGQVELKGCLCEGECKKGPNIKINDVLFSNVTPEGINDLLDHELEQNK